MVDDRRPLGGVEHLGSQADQAAGGNREGGEREFPAGLHFQQFAAALAGHFHDRAKLVKGDFDDQQFVGLALDAVDLPEQDLGLADRQFVTFPGASSRSGWKGAGHRGPRPETGRIGIRRHPQGNVPLQFPHQSLAQLTAGQIPSFAT